MELNAEVKESDSKVAKIQGGLSVRLNAKKSEKIALCCLASQH